MTDILLKNGDVTLSASGDYLFAKGIDKVLQKAVMYAQIRKGSFIYSKALGTEIRGIDVNSPKAIKNASLLLKEALIDDTEYTVEVESISKTSEGRISMLIAVSNEKETRKQEVTLSADL